MTTYAVPLGDLKLYVIFSFGKLVYIKESASYNHLKGER